MRGGSRRLASYYRKLSTQVLEYSKSKEVGKPESDGLLFSRGGFAQQHGAGVAWLGEEMIGSTKSE